MVNFTRKDRKGERFGSLTVIDFGKDYGKSSYKLLCQCDCGVQKEIARSSLTSGLAKSCGCAKSTRKESESPTYSSWEAMRQRCNNPNATMYEYYGGRGIEICKEWDTFSKFLEDMGERPFEHVLDRIDQNGRYSPENCRWVSKSESSFNTRKQHNNTSGKTGVCWSVKENRWIARIDFQGKAIRLGAFKCIDSAISARKEAEIKYFGYNKD